MADRTPLKFADRDTISDNDPFAELTRIMGFDPRQPVTRKETPDPVIGDDFDIDLEKELMGEFGLDEEERAPAVNAAPEVAVSPAEPAMHEAPSHDFSAHELDEAIAASMQDFSVAEDEARHSPAPEVDFDRDFDDALTQTFETPAFDSRTDWSDREESAAAAEEDVFADDAAPEIEAASARDFETHFDDAMAEVDLDFDLHDEPAETPASEQVAAPQIAVEAQDEEADFLADAPEAEDPFDDAFSLDLNEVEAAAPAVEPVAAPQERSLEDELNALLGNMGASISRPQDTPLPQVQVADERAAPAVDPFAVAAAGYSAPQAPAVDPFAVAAVGYSAHQAPAVDPFEVAAAGYGAHQASADDAASTLDALAADLLQDDEAQARAGDVDIDFDPADLDAFTNDAEAERKVAAAPVPAASIFSRTWNRATPVQPAQPNTAEEAPAAPIVEEPAPAADAYAYQPEPAYTAETQEAVEQVEPQEEAAPAAVDDGIPDVETVDVPERVEALADDLDLPELVFEEDRPASAAFDDLDAEFAGLINEINEADLATPPASTSTYDDEPYESGFRQAAEWDDTPAYVMPGAAAATAAAATASHAADFDAANADARPFAPAESFDADPLDYDPQFDEAIAMPEPAATAGAAQPSRRGLIAAAVVGAVVVVGGLGAFLLSPGGSGGGAPVLVKADDAPIKVKPENPGGTVVPNQDNKVYDAVAKGIQPTAPEQQKLVVDAQQPVNVNTAAPQNRVVDLPADEDAGDGAGDVVAADAPRAKSEDRLDPATQTAAANTDQEDVALVSPRKVRTMIVKPDGTLAPREDTTAVAATEPADPAPQRVSTAPLSGEQTGTVPAAADAQESAPKPAAKAGNQSPTTPKTVAAAPQRPSDQPVDVVGEVKPDQVAAIAPATAASGAWAMQIASQPSAEAAQSSYNDLARRYAGVLGGKPVSIVKAEIAGKGTFYRVRIPADSRNDAIKLCESYKAAGGNCFVSK
jgi:hypothetical protein